MRRVGWGDQILMVMRMGENVKVSSMDHEAIMMRAKDINKNN